MIAVMMISDPIVIARTCMQFSVTEFIVLSCLGH